MPKVNLPIANGFYVSDSLPISNQECVNWYANIPQTPGALSLESLYGCPGISQALTTGAVNQVNRGAHVKNSKPYFVNGTSLYRVDKSVDGDGLTVFTSVLLGTIPGSGRVSMADNGTQLMVLVPGGNGYIIDESSGTPFVQITAPGFTANGAPQLVEFVDSFFVCNTDTTKYISGCPMVVRTHVEGFENGKWTYYYDSTNITAWEMNYLVGQKHGKFVYFNPIGDTTLFENYTPRPRPTSSIYVRRRTFFH